MSFVTIGNDCCLLISRFIEDCKDWFSLRSSCKRFWILCSFEEAQKLWGHMINHSFFMKPDSFLKWKDNLVFYRNLKNFRPIVKTSLMVGVYDFLDRDYPFSQQKKVQYTQNEIVYCTRLFISVVDKQTNKTLLYLDQKQYDYELYVAVADYHLFVWKLNSNKLSVYDSSSLKQGKELTVLSLAFNLFYPKKANGNNRTVYIKDRGEVSFKSKLDLWSISLNHSSGYISYEDDLLDVKIINSKQLKVTFPDSCIYLGEEASGIEIFRFSDYLIIITNKHASPTIIRYTISKNSLINRTILLRLDTISISVEMINHFLFILLTSRFHLTQLDILSGKTKEYPLVRNYDRIEAFTTCLVLVHRDSKNNFALDFA